MSEQLFTLAELTPPQDSHERPEADLVRDGWCLRVHWRGGVWRMPSEESVTAGRVELGRNWRLVKAAPTEDYLPGAPEVPDLSALRCPKCGGPVCRCECGIPRCGLLSCRKCTWVGPLSDCAPAEERWPLEYVNRGTGEVLIARSPDIGPTDLCYLPHLKDWVCTCIEGLVEVLGTLSKRPGPDGAWAVMRRRT